MVLQFFRLSTGSCGGFLSVLGSLIHVPELSCRTSLPYVLAKICGVRHSSQELSPSLAVKLLC